MKRQIKVTVILLFFCVGSYSALAGATHGEGQFGDGCFGVDFCTADSSGSSSSSTGGSSSGGGGDYAECWVSSQCSAGFSCINRSCTEGEKIIEREEYEHSPDPNIENVTESIFRDTEAFVEPVTRKGNFFKSYWWLFLVFILTLLWIWRKEIINNHNT